MKDLLEKRFHVPKNTGVQARVCVCEPTLEGGVYSSGGWGGGFGNDWGGAFSHSFAYIP